MSNFRIYKTTSKIEVKIDGISIFISPLSVHQKMELQSEMVKASNGDMNAAMEAVVKALKMSIKDIKGVITSDDEGKDVDYVLGFDGEELSDECVNDLLNMPISNKISQICTGLLAGVPDKILGPDGLPLEGVTIVRPKMEKAAPKK